MARYCASVTLIALVLRTLLLTLVSGRVHDEKHHTHKLPQAKFSAAEDVQSINSSGPDHFMSALDSLDALRLQKRQAAATTTTWTTVLVTSTITRTITTTGPVASATQQPDAGSVGDAHSSAFDAKGSTNIAVYYGQSPGTVLSYLLLSSDMM